MNRADFLEKVFDFEKSKEWIYQGEKPCLIDFHDEACPPCMKVASVIEKLAVEFADSVIFYKVDVHSEETLPQELGVVNLPTLVFCPIHGRPIVREGAASEEQLREIIHNELLNQ